MLINTTQFVERSQFFNGQRLFASDLQELEAFNREMRWLHNQSLHQPGIGSGYVPNGQKGDREVTIDPGYALDAYGREIVLTQTHTEPVPPVADDDEGNPVLYDLTVSYPSDAELSASETREGICLPRGVVRLREEPVFCWVQLTVDQNGNAQPRDVRLARQIRDGLRIVIARAEVFNCQLERDLCTAQRRNARAATQPYIACGRSHADWAWLTTAREIIGIQADIDTTHARFRITPCYLARLEDVKAPSDEREQLLSALRAFFVVQIANSTLNGFTVKAYAPYLSLIANSAGRPLGEFKRLFSSSKAKAAKAQRDKNIESFGRLWQVAWFGVES